MNTYGQEHEVQLLSRIVPMLESRKAIDVGAERGEFVEALLEGGAIEVHAFEPEPDNVVSLRKRFGSDRRVTVHDIAVSNADGQLTLRLSKDPLGNPLSFGHTVLERPDTDEIAWDGSLSVQSRSLKSLAESGEIPSRAGVLKIDTEGHDLAVLAGMGAIECDVIIVEHWLDLPHSLGPCPWTIDEIASAAAGHGFSHFAFLHHLGELTILQWDAAELAVGSMGNILFIHDRVYERLLPVLLECSSSLAMAAADIAEARGTAAAERLVVIEELKREVAIQAQAAAERLAVLDGLEESSR